MTTLRSCDLPRIATLLEAVRAVMDRGEWMTLSEIRFSCAGMGVHGSEAGISARLRDLRKPQHGSRVVERKRLNDRGLFAYRLIPQHVPGEQLRLGGFDV